MSMSLYSVINLSRIIFTIALSVLFLGEKLTLTIIVGVVIIILGLMLVNKISNTKDKKETTLKPVLLLLFSCLLNAISATIDKEILRYITPSQLQFWFLLFLTILCLLLILCKKQKIDFKNIRKNYWIFIAGISLVIADKFLFLANEIPTSKVSIMTLIKQASAIEGIILGKILFKEKNIIKKLLCSAIIIFGIILVLI